MPVLEFDLDGVTFGTGRPVQLADVALDAAGLLVDDVATNGRPGVTVGRDSEGGAPWTFTLFAAGADEAAGRTALATVANVWAAAKRLAPGVLQTLRYTTAGRTRRVYGRARRWAPPSIDAFAAAGSPSVVADFLQTDPRFYADDAGQTSVGIVPASSSGLILPAAPPWLWSSPGVPLSRRITVGGDTATPVEVTFHGPVTNPAVEIAGVRLTLVGTLAYDEAITVDTRTKTARWSAGRSGSAAGLLGPRVRLADLVVPPGAHDVTFSGTDLTGTATCTVAWRDAWTSP